MDSWTYLIWNVVMIFSCKILNLLCKMPSSNFTLLVQLSSADPLVPTYKFSIQLVRGKHQPPFWRRVLKTNQAQPLYMHHHIKRQQQQQQQQQQQNKTRNIFNASMLSANVMRIPLRLIFKKKIMLASFFWAYLFREFAM